MHNSPLPSPLLLGLQKAVIISLSIRLVLFFLLKSGSCANGQGTGTCSTRHTGGVSKGYGYHLACGNGFGSLVSGMGVYSTLSIPQHGRGLALSAG
ncbi:hypothetical protein LX32DRAFT_714231 [Colletotrichum zoysiae]|uniref:Uncharacterized protein n=1 Tax=Colletotrichum zoysiae TaxID=1216348 RepID=A0AAD9LWL7_9PEZI|nr:hypothetical protein LX32DRAFT_714231 [Colletotrichum zoysiae]